MKLDEMVTKVGRKTKVDDVTTRRVIREVLASMKEEISALGDEGRVMVPTLGAFIVRGPRAKNGRNRIFFNPWQPRENAEPENKAKSSQDT